MNEIEKLNERIAQLTELVKSGEETINATKEMLKLAEEERDRLADQRRESEPKFERVGFCEMYSSIRLTHDCAIVEYERDIDGTVDQDHFNNNNYFHTKERADEVASKINFLLRLERLHDTFCPDYVPDWSDGCFKHYVYFNVARGRYACSWTTNSKDEIYVYFPTEEIAQKVCDILNAELEEHYEN